MISILYVIHGKERIPTLHTQHPISLEAHRIISQNQGLVFPKEAATEGNDKTYNTWGGYIMFYGHLLLYFRIISEIVYNVHFLCYVLYNQVLLPIRNMDIMDIYIYT